MHVYQLLSSYLVRYIAVYRAFRSFCTFSLYSSLNEQLQRACKLDLSATAAREIAAVPDVDDLFMQYVSLE